MNTLIMAQKKAAYHTNRRRVPEMVKKLNRLPSNLSVKWLYAN
jgi:hypothetical protein